MSYIVPDKIPSYCAECDWSICLYPNAYCKRVHKTSELLMAIEKRPDFCPLIEIPTPHGELVDRNGLMDTYADRLTAVAERYSPDSSECGILSGAMKLLAIMPTVIEAEGET